MRTHGVRARAAVVATVCLFVFIPEAPVPYLGRSPGEVQGLCILPSPLSKWGQNSNLALFFLLLLFSFLVLFSQKRFDYDFEFFHGFLSHKTNKI